MPFLPLATTASNSRIFFWLSVSSASIVLGCDVKVRPDGDGMRRRDSAAVGNAYRIGGGSGTVKERLVKVAAMPAARTRRAGSAAMIVRGFAAIAGHERTITMLRAHQAAGRLAHAYCLIGEEGIGKAAVARALAEELLLGEGQPSRLEVHPDFWSDDRAEAISIDEIRFHPERGAQAHDQSLQQFLSLKPFVAPLRVALLANAERMTEAAQNCLLKTLEEPPPNTVLVLTTAYPDHLLPTCLSRCQLVAVSPVGRSTLAGFIASRSGTPEEAEALAGLAHGRPGWAVRAMLDREWVARLDRWAEELSALAFEDVDGVLTYAARFGQGPQADMRLVVTDALRGFTAFLRDAMLLQAGLLARMPASRQSALETWVARVPADHARASLAAAQRTQLLIDQNVNPRLAMEVMLLDLRVRRPA
ncbi:MAG: AAA family ATPase [Chloroflexi bacterium]|nr:MAG: AAA family ATPase [Chloroflexota bacterium]